MSIEEFEKKHGIAPYKAAEMAKQAANIVNKLLMSSTSFSQPYFEAKIVVEMVYSLIDKAEKAQKGEVK